MDKILRGSLIEAVAFSIFMIRKGERNMQCKKCGKEIPEGTKFCPYCGAPQTEETTPVQQQNYEQNNTPVQSNNDAGKGAATASLVLGIVSVVCWFTGVGAIISVVCGIIGLVTANNAKKAGFEGGIRTAGFVLSIIGLVGGGIVFAGALACVGTVGSLAGIASSLS